MQIIKGAWKLYVNEWQMAIDNSTMEDVIKMGLLGILLLIGGVLDHVLGL